MPTVCCCSPKPEDRKLIPERIVQGHNMRADALFAKGMYTESYNEYFKAKKLAKDNLDNCSLSELHTQPWHGALQAGAVSRCSISI